MLNQEKAVRAQACCIIFIGMTLVVYLVIFVELNFMQLSRGSQIYLQDLVYMFCVFFFELLT